MKNANAEAINQNVKKLNGQAYLLIDDNSVIGPEYEICMTFESADERFLNTVKAK